jgi:hypothetical protein
MQGCVSYVFLILTENKYIFRFFIMDDQAGVTNFGYDVTPDVALTVFD